MSEQKFRLQKFWRVGTSLDAAFAKEFAVGLRTNGALVSVNVLDNNMDCIAYEDTLREMFGIHAFTAFTLDKVIANAVRQLQHLVTDESSNDCWDLYLSEKRLSGTGGEVATSNKRYFQELLYQKKSEKLLADENCFKIVIVSATFKTNSFYFNNDFHL